MDLKRETGSEFMPKWTDDGLLPAIVVAEEDNAVLMLGYMNAEALAKTQTSGLLHFWSRSRQRLWKKGESSENLLHVVEILVDCDQDALLIRARADGPTCHTGQRSCFYRRLDRAGLAKL